MNNASAQPTPVRRLESFVISADGAKIYYHQMGKGPGLIIVPGAATEAEEYFPLADALASKYTVYIPERRGCGRSTPAGYDYGIAKEQEDMLALIQVTKAHYLFGHSSGGIICLETAMVTPLRGLILFEPPLSQYGSVPSDWLPKYMQAISRGDQARAMVTALKGGMRFNNAYWLPKWFLIPLVRYVVLKGKKPTPKDLDLAANWAQNFKIVWATDATYPKYKAITVPTLLLGGTVGPQFLRDALGWLEQTIPHAKRQTLAGLDHGGPTQEGSPGEVAKALLQFVD